MFIKRITSCTNLSLHAPKKNSPKPVGTVYDT